MKNKRIACAAMAALTTITGVMSAPTATAATKLSYGNIVVSNGQTKTFPLKGAHNPFCDPREITVGDGDYLHHGFVVGMIDPDCNIVASPKTITRDLNISTTVRVLNDGVNQNVDTVVHIKANGGADTYTPAPAPSTGSGTGEAMTKIYNKHHKPRADKLTIKVGTTTRTTMYDLPDNAVIEVDPGLTNPPGTTRWAHVEGHQLVVHPNKGDTLPGKYGNYESFYNMMFGDHIMVRFVFPDNTVRNFAVPITVDQSTPKTTPKKKTDPTPKKKVTTTPKATTKPKAKTTPAPAPKPEKKKVETKPKATSTPKASTKKKATTTTAPAPARTTTQASKPKADATPKKKTDPQPAPKPTTAPKVDKPVVVEKKAPAPATKAHEVTAETLGWGESKAAETHAEAAPAVTDATPPAVNLNDFDNSINVQGNTDAEGETQASEKSDAKPLMIAGAVGLLGIIAAIIAAIQSGAIVMPQL